MKLLLLVTCYMQAVQSTDIAAVSADVQLRNYFDQIVPLSGQNIIDGPVYIHMSDFEFPLVQSHTYQHQRWRNFLMYIFIGITLVFCTVFGITYSLLFDI